MQILEYLDLRDNLLVDLPVGEPLANHKALKAILLQVGVQSYCKGIAKKV